MRKTVKVVDMVNLYKETLKTAIMDKNEGILSDAGAMGYIICKLVGESVQVQAFNETIDEAEAEGYSWFKYE